MSFDPLTPHSWRPDVPDTPVSRLPSSPLCWPSSYTCSGTKKEALSPHPQLPTPQLTSPTHSSRPYSPGRYSYSSLLGGGFPTPERYSYSSLLLKPPPRPISLFYFSKHSSGGKRRAHRARHSVHAAFPLPSGASLPNIPSAVRGARFSVLRSTLPHSPHCTQFPTPGGVDSSASQSCSQDTIVEGVARLT